MSEFKALVVEKLRLVDFDEDFEVKNIKEFSDGVEFEIGDLGIILPENKEVSYYQIDREGCFDWVRIDLMLLTNVHRVIQEIIEEIYLEE